MERLSAKSFMAEALMSLNCYLPVVTSPAVEPLLVKSGADQSAPILVNIETRIYFLPRANNSFQGGIRSIFESVEDCDP